MTESLLRTIRQAPTVRWFGVSAAAFFLAVVTFYVLAIDPRAPSLAELPDAVQETTVILLDDELSAEASRVPSRFTEVTIEPYWGAILPGKRFAVVTYSRTGYRGSSGASIPDLVTLWEIKLDDDNGWAHLRAEYFPVNDWGRPSFSFTPDGSHLYVIEKEEDRTEWLTEYEIQPESTEPFIVRYRIAGGFGSPVVHPDGRHLLVGKRGELAITELPLREGWLRPFITSGPDDAIVELPATLSVVAINATGTHVLLSNTDVWDISDLNAPIFQGRIPQRMWTSTIFPDDPPEFREGIAPASISDDGHWIMANLRWELHGLFHREGDSLEWERSWESGYLGEFTRFAMDDRVVLTSSYGDALQVNVLRRQSPVELAPIFGVQQIRRDQSMPISSGPHTTHLATTDDLRWVLACPFSRDKLLPMLIRVPDRILRLAETFSDDLPVDALPRRQPEPTPGTGRSP